MQVFVKDVEGQSVPIDVDATSTAGYVKQMFADEQGMDMGSLTLTCGGRCLEDSDVILQNGITEESTLFLNLELLGGGKKRKKKTYTKPKKIKHKRKKVKLAVLKYYKVDSNDKVTRLRRECPHELCGPGVFMGMHFNRYYCGRCHLTYLIKKGE
uniref:Ribosomal protein S27a n=1 Tax=Amphidinium carterae TaxID=2961 RepID=F8QQL2_AMPCA|nr:ribosomal protein S27a [Amphidinium carterae]